MIFEIMVMILILSLVPVVIISKKWPATEKYCNGVLYIFLFITLVTGLYLYTDSIRDQIIIVLVAGVLAVIQWLHYKILIKTKWVYLSFVALFICCHIGFTIVSKHLLVGLNAGFYAAFYGANTVNTFYNNEIFSSRKKALTAMGAILTIVLFVVIPINEKRNNKPVIQAVSYCRDKGLMYDEDYTIYIPRDQNRTKHSPISIILRQENAEGKRHKLKAIYINNKITIVGEE